MTDRRHERNFTQLEVGGWYELQDGSIEQFVCLKESSKIYKFIGVHFGDTYLSNGDILDNSESDSNVIKRVKVVDWDEPSEAQPATLADKLASEMIVREHIMVEIYKTMLSHPNRPVGMPLSGILTLADGHTTALINAMERGDTDGK